MSAYRQGLVLGAVLLGTVQAWAGNLDSPGAPTAPASAMYTIEAVYNRLDTGAAGATQVFTDPASGPTAGTMHTLDEVMAKAPLLDAANGATAAQVLSGTTFWGLLSGGWGPRTGTMANNGAVTITPTATAQTIPAGYHNGTGSVDGDADLVSGNIKAGVTVFGVAGDPNVVNTSSGDATAADLLASKKAWVDGAEVTGSLATRTLSAANDTVQAGYYAATTLSSVDADLAAANIRAGANIFGVSGDSAVVNTSSGNATAADLLAGKTAYVNGAQVTGSAAAGANVTGSAGALVMTIPNGLYSGSKTATANDADLVTGNIRAGVNLFGVNGKTEVVDTTTGDATAANLAGGKKAWVDGLEVTGTAKPAPVVKTGAQNSIGGYTPVAGEDRHASMQKGVAWPNPRFTDNLNGTVTDNLTGLIWLKNAGFKPNETWSAALNICATLQDGTANAGLTDGSVAGAWRLPNVRELQSLIYYGNYWPSLPNTTGTDKWTAGNPFDNVLVNIRAYWSSTTTAEGGGNAAYNLDFTRGYVNNNSKTAGCAVWPVRGP